MNKYAELMLRAADEVQDVRLEDGEVVKLPDPFADELRAAAAEMGQQEPVYQVRFVIAWTDSGWKDVGKDEFEHLQRCYGARFKGRVLYHAPVAPKEQEPELCFKRTSSGGILAYSPDGYQRNLEKYIGVNLYTAPAARAAVSDRDRLAPAVPEGWKLVPVKPTSKQLGEAWNYIDFGESQANTPLPVGMVAGIYKAMISASPEPEEHNADGAEMRREAERWKHIALEMHDALVGDKRAGAYDHDRMEKALKMLDAAMKEEA